MADISGVPEEELQIDIWNHLLRNSSIKGGEDNGGSDDDVVSRYHKPKGTWYLEPANYREEARNFKDWGWDFEKGQWYDFDNPATIHTIKDSSIQLYEYNYK